MDLEALYTAVAKDTEESDANGIALLTTAVGKLHEARAITDETAEVDGPILAMVVLLAFKAAIEGEIDIIAEIETHIEEMAEQREQAESLEEAIANEDYEAVAESMGLTDDDDEDNTRAFA